MIVHVSPDAPFLIRAAAGGALALHIGGGTLGIVAGGVALAVRKGGRLHRLSGDVFVVSMVVAMTIAAITAPLLPQVANVPGAVFTAYLVITAWATVRRRPGEIGALEMGAAGVPALAAVALAAIGWLGSRNPHGLIDGVPFQAAVGMSVVCALAAALDVRMILRGGISGAARIARHVWRMCAALLFAAASFFIGQPQVFPPPLRGSWVLDLPVLAIAAAMVFWLVRIRFAAALRALSLKRSPA